MFYAKYQHSAVKYENACTILQTRLKSHTISNKVETAWLFEKHGGECGIRTHVPFRTTAFRVQLVMNSPNQCIRIVKSNDDITLCIISHFAKKSKLFFKIVLVHKFHLDVLVKIISFVVFSLVLQKGLTFPEKSIIIK